MESWEKSTKALRHTLSDYCEADQIAQGREPWNTASTSTRLNAIRSLRNRAQREVANAFQALLPDDAEEEDTP